MTALRPRLPAGIQACLFDLDGVLTDTATVHTAAWKEMFDSYLLHRAARGDELFVPLDPVHDYYEYIDGRPRSDGVRSFLASRGIHLSEGTRSDPPGAETVGGLANRKNELVLEMMSRGVNVFEGSLLFVRSVRRAGLRCAVVSASANCGAVLAAAGIADLFDARVDGLDVEREHLRGKPAPDTFLAAARKLGADPKHAAVFEDALAGVEAGRAGGFGIVVGVNRGDQADALKAHGADIVVSDLAELLDP